MIHRFPSASTFLPVILLVLSGSVMADVIVVSPKESLIDAVVASQTGDEIHLEPGDHHLPPGESLVTTGKEILIRGARGGDGAWLSRIHSHDASAIMHSGTSAVLELEDLAFMGTVDGVSGTDTPVALRVDHGRVTVRDCLFDQCVAPLQDGGAVQNLGSMTGHVTLFYDCTFRDCVGLYAGGIYQWKATTQSGGIRWPVDNCLFERNRAGHSSGAGAIHTTKYGAVVTDSVFRDNQAGTQSTDPMVARSIYSGTFQSEFSGTSFCSPDADAMGIDHVYPFSNIDGAFNCLSNDCTDSDGDLRPDQCDQCDGPDVDADDSGWADCHESVDDDGRRVLTVASGTRIEHAIGAAGANDVIQLEAGNYYLPIGESLVTTGKEILIRGTRGVDGSWLTRIHSQDATAIEHSGTGAVLELEDLAFTGGVYAASGTDTPVALRVHQGRATVRGCLFDQCVAPLQDGGAVQNLGALTAHVTLFYDCTFRDCVGLYAGGIYQMKATTQSGTISWPVENCFFQRNHANYHSGAGAIHTTKYGVLVTDSVFSENTAGTGDHRAGISISASVFPALLAQTDFCSPLATTDLVGHVLGATIDKGGLCFTTDCSDIDQDGIPDGCDDHLCTSDVNGDGLVDGNDVAAILSAWGPCGDEDCRADIDGDGDVGPRDLAYVLGEWGGCGQGTP